MGRAKPSKLSHPQRPFNSFELWSKQTRNPTFLGSVPTALISLCDVESSIGHCKSENETSDCAWHELSKVWSLIPLSASDPHIDSDSVLWTNIRLNFTQIYSIFQLLDLIKVFEISNFAGRIVHREHLSSTGLMDSRKVAWELPLPTLMIPPNATMTKPSKVFRTEFPFLRGYVSF